MIKPNLNPGFGHMRVGNIGQSIKFQGVNSEDLILEPLVSPRFPVDIFNHQACLNTGLLAGSKEHKLVHRYLKCILPSIDFGNLKYRHHVGLLINDLSPLGLDNVLQAFVSLAG